MTDGAGRRVMVVDDDEAVRALVRDLLVADGWEVSEADTGARALALLGAMPAPDLMLLDLVMPGVDGLAVLAEIREARGMWDLPVLVLSAGRAHLSNKLALSRGADDVLAKPLDAAVLRERCSALATSGPCRSSAGARPA